MTLESLEFRRPTVSRSSTKTKSIVEVFALFKVLASALSLGSSLLRIIRLEEW